MSRFYTWADLASERRNAQASERTALEAMALCEMTPSLDEDPRVDRLEETIRVQYGHAAALKRSHRRVRSQPRGRSRRCPGGLRGNR
jgi:hypothetical protein